MDPKPYLDYLDKEMTIMGILSGFCVALAALATDRISAADAGTLKTIWESSAGLVLAGSGAALAAALWFYRQRSLLAWYFGQITLAQVRSDRAGQDVRQLLDDADGWDTWINYQRGFGYLVLSLVPYSLAFIRAAWPGLPGSVAMSATIAAFIVTAVTLESRAYVLRTYSDRDDPFKTWWTQRRSRRQHHGA